MFLGMDACLSWLGCHAHFMHTGTLGMCICSCDGQLVGAWGCSTVVSCMEQCVILTISGNMLRVRECWSKERETERIL